MSPEERIEEFNRPGGMEGTSFSELTGRYFERGKAYKIANDYCIGVNKNNYVIKVTCKNGYKPITVLPFERSFAFEFQDDDGIYYENYLKELWQVFNKLGVEGIKQEIDRENDVISDRCRQYAKQMRYPYFY